MAVTLTQGEALEVLQAAAPILASAMRRNPYKSSDGQRGEGGNPTAADALERFGNSTHRINTDDADALVAAVAPE